MKRVMNFLHKNELLGAVLVSGFILVVMFIGVNIAKADKSPDVRHIASVKHEGYAPSPEYYIVEASGNKVWKDTKSILTVLGFLMAVASGCSILYGDYNPEGPHSYRTGFMILAFWGASLLLAFGPYVAKEGDSSYVTQLCADEYEKHKDNLDALFPSVDNSPIKCE